jgi:hypothetical protein
LLRRRIILFGVIVIGKRKQGVTATSKREKELEPAPLGLAFTTSIT